MSVNVKTNWRERLFLTADQVPDRVLELQFGHLTDLHEHSFFNYRDRWYCLDGFMHVDERSPFYPFWAGYSHGTYDCGTVLHLCDDPDYYIVGRFY